MRVNISAENVEVLRGVRDKTGYTVRGPFGGGWEVPNEWCTVRPEPISEGTMVLAWQDYEREGDARLGRAGNAPGSVYDNAGHHLGVFDHVRPVSREDLQGGQES